MNGKEIMALLSKGIVPPRVPFAPTVYEHGARILNITPSRLARDAELLCKSQLAAYEMYRHDIVTVGADIYNIEAEALGSRVIYYEDNTIPSIEQILIEEPSDLENLHMPDPYKDGRMPLVLEACKEINSKIGCEVPVSSAIVGPFTLAAILRGYENFLMDLINEEEFAKKQLKFASGTGLRYAKALIDNGIGVSVNESWIAPPLLSPSIFKDIVFDFEKAFISQIKALGIPNVALISGGNTTPIAEYLVKTGTSLLMADSCTDQKAYKALCDRWEINLRASISPVKVEQGDEAEMYNAARHVIENCSHNGRFIFGCGVVSIDTDPKNIIKLKTIVDKLNPYS